MNIIEACGLLGIPVGASVDDAKKAFKKKAVELHPDVNKAPDAEAKFKQINEAFQLVEKHGTKPPSVNDVTSRFYDPGADFAEELRRQMYTVFNSNFGMPNQVKVPPTVVSLDIPFEASVVGGRHTVVYDRLVKCKDCSVDKVQTDCVKCNGKGYRKYKSQDEKELPCNTCKGTGKVIIFKGCAICNGKGVVKKTEKARFTIPAGIAAGFRLILEGKGDYYTGDKHGNLIVNVNILPDKDMYLDGTDVISVIELSLLDALRGQKMKVRTIKGEKTLAFKPRTKNKDTVRIAGYGVPPNGTHTFIVNVNYPEDVSELIRVLDPEPKPESELENVNSD